MNVENFCLFWDQRWLTQIFLACLATPACGLEAIEENHPHHLKRNVIVSHHSSSITCKQSFLFQHPTEDYWFSASVTCIGGCFFWTFSSEQHGTNVRLVSLWSCSLFWWSTFNTTTLPCHNLARQPPYVLCLRTELSPPSPSPPALSKVKNSIMHGAGGGQLFLAICPSHA